MSRWGYELFNNLCGVYHVLLQAMLFFVLWDIFCRPKREKKALAAAGVFLAVNMFFCVCPAVPDGTRYVVSAFLVLGYSWIQAGRYPGEWGYSRIQAGPCLEKAVFVLLLFYNFHAMSFLVSNSIYQYLIDEMLGRMDQQHTDYMFQMYRCQMIGLSLNFLVYTLFFLLLTGTVKKIVKKPYSMHWHDVLFLSALNLAGSMLVWIIVDLLAVQIEKEVFFLFTQRRGMLWKIPLIAVLICVGEISAVYIFQKYKELQSEREKHFVEEQQTKAMKRRLEEAENFYGSVRRARHEMKGHMANIKGLAAGKKYEEVESYIEKLDETIQKLDYQFSTGNAVTDVVINDKYQKAVKAGISCSIKFDYRESDTISAFDMGIVLNNLLDNAIEACEKLEQTKRRISLTLKRKNHFLLVEVENSFDGRLEWDDEENIPITAKHSNLPDMLIEHGIGLKNVKDVAERYLGYMDIKAEKQVFKVTVMLQQKEMGGSQV